ncbi:MAG TPA: hypothetical protein VHD90_01360 [Phototrophicaceae bacterium]|nr:hypothetical protein [Phototrophicaceae bacterium]
MGLNLEWYDEDKSIIYVTFEGKVESRELLNRVPDFQAMLGSVSQRVDVIFDPTRQLYFSPDYFQITRKLHLMKYPNLRLVVFVGKTLAWELFIAFTRQFGRIPYQFAQAATVADARTLIERAREQDADLPPLSSLRLN